MSAPRRARRRPYKEVRLQQLRSFAQTARLGSLAAAAAALGVAQPTVWEQVHALERDFDAKLVEPYGRGCRLTEDGRLLLGLVDPLVASLDSLRRHFVEARAKVETNLAVAATPRILVEDLPECVLAFERRWPNVRLAFKETRDQDVTEEVEAGTADVGLAPIPESQTHHPRLVFEPCYDLDVVLITPPDHPLARRRHVRPNDLRAYALINSPNSFLDPALTAHLEKLGLFRVQPRRVEAFFAATIRQYVELGFGIGLLPRPALKPYPNLHCRVMSRYFGRLRTYLIWRKGTLRSPAAEAFAAVVKTKLNPGGD
jgi:DNA-binding transcriptional LysR family regulator